MATAQTCDVGATLAPFVLGHRSVYTSNIYLLRNINK